MRAQQERACTWTKRGTEGDKQETGQGGAGGLHTIPTSPQRSLARRPHRALQVAAMYWTVACKPRSTHWALPIARADGWKQATAADLASKLLLTPDRNWPANIMHELLEGTTQSHQAQSVSIFQIHHSAFRGSGGADDLGFA
ncbi:hypothetical protein VTI28DRAFT_3285 [Corynascus sepedonium]